MTIREAANYVLTEVGEDYEWLAEHKPGLALALTELEEAISAEDRRERGQE